MQANPSELSSYTTLTNLTPSSTISYRSEMGSRSSTDIVPTTMGLGGYICFDVVMMVFYVSQSILEGLTWIHVSRFLNFDYLSLVRSEAGQEH